MSYKGNSSCNYLINLATQRENDSCQINGTLFVQTDKSRDEFGSIASTNALNTNVEQTFNDSNQTTAVLSRIIAPNQPKHRTEFQPRKYGCCERAF